MEEPKISTTEYRWYIGVLADGTYRFITPESLDAAEKYIGDHGGGVYTHAGYLVMASSPSWWRWLSKEYDAQYGSFPLQNRPPHIDVPNIDCFFSKEALKWLEDNDDMLKTIGGKYYDNIPRH